MQEWPEVKITVVLKKRAPTQKIWTLKQKKWIQRKIKWALKQKKEPYSIIIL